MHTLTTKFINCVFFHLRIVLASVTFDIGSIYFITISNKFLFELLQFN